MAKQISTPTAMSGKAFHSLSRLYAFSGQIYYKYKQFPEAFKNYHAALLHYNDEDFNQYKYQLALGKASCRMMLLNKARVHLNNVLNLSVKREAPNLIGEARRYLELLDRLEKNNEYISSNNKTISDLTYQMLWDFSRITRPLRICMIPESMKPAFSIDDFLIKQKFSAHEKNENRHFIFLDHSIWSQTSKRVLMGALAQKLSSIEWKETKSESLIPKTEKHGLNTFSHNRITDQLAIAKGYGPHLYLARKYQEAREDNAMLHFMPSSKILDILKKYRPPNSVEEKSFLRAGY